ncbi:MAG: hypothetical protein DYG89_34970 [Caldilinea sp. CFX5]|nr:hypothetical protein [Caldilinea sp. CFX5]
MQTISNPTASITHFIKGVAIGRPAHSPRRRCLLAFMLVISILMTACGGAEDESASVANQASTPPDNVVAIGDFGLTEEELLQAIEEIEPKIAQCMNAAGFEYVAVDSNTVREAMDADKELPGLSEEQFYNQYGLGISTLYTGEPPQLAAIQTTASLGLGEQNIAIFQSLSPTDRIAYNQTLLGEHLDFPLAVALEREDIARTGGCTRAAIEQVIPADRLTVTYVNPKDYTIDNDPRMVEAFVKFGECIKEAGYDITNPDDIRPLITARLDEITGGAPVAALSAEAKAALAELQTFEVALASASFACEEKIITPLRAQIEQELAG